MVPAPELPPGPRSALIIATAAYADQALAQLRAPAQDAVALAGVLGDPAIGGFAVTQVVDQDEREMRRAAARFLDGRGTSELVLVYLSCHGLLDARGRLFFAASDTDKGMLSATAVESTWLTERLEECRARQQILILDCCFSGAFARGSKGTVDLETKLADPGRGRVVLTASREGEYSFEGEELTNQQIVTSVFTAGLVDGLATGNADADRDGLISVEDAFVYAARQVLEQGGAQTPQRWLYAAEGPIVLARSPAGKVITPAPLPEHLTTSLDSPSPLVRIAAVHELGELLTGPNPALTLAARDALEQVSEHDSPRVAAVSREILQAIQDIGDENQASHASVAQDALERVAEQSSPQVATISLRQAAPKRLAEQDSPQVAAASRHMAMTQEEILAGLCEILDEIAGVPADWVTPEMTFVDDLDIDSLSMVEIAVVAQDKFGMEIPDNQLKDLRTVQDAIDYIQRSSV